MIRVTFAAAALLLAGTANAQSFYPGQYGLRFCELRQMGLSLEQSRSTAMNEAWSNDRPEVIVNYKGKPVSLDVLDAVKIVLKTCPELAR